MCKCIHPKSKRVIVVVLIFPTLLEEHSSSAALSVTGTIHSGYDDSGVTEHRTLSTGTSTGTLSYIRFIYALLTLYNTLYTLLET